MVIKRILVLKGFEIKENIKWGFDRFNRKLFNIIKEFVLYQKKNKGKRVD